MDLKRSPSAYTNAKSIMNNLGFFENSHYDHLACPHGRQASAIFENQEDDDPLYEILNCHKVTYIEQKLANPLNQFEKITHPKEDVDFMLQN